MGMYNSESVLTSEKAYTVLRAIVKKQEEGDYATGIAEQHNMDQSMVSEIISKFENIGLLKKGKRTRAQYYEFDPEGIFPLFRKIVQEEIIQDKENDFLENRKGWLDSILPYDLEKALNEDLDILLRNFFEDYVYEFPDSDVKACFEFFLDGAEMIDTSKQGNPKWMKAVKDMAKYRHDFGTDPEFLLEKAILEYEGEIYTIEDKNQYLLNPDEEDKSIRPIDFKPHYECPKCSRINPTKIGEHECPECGSIFENPDALAKFFCPICGDEIEDPEHGETSECGCGVILNKAERTKEIHEFVHGSRDSIPEN